MSLPPLFLAVLTAIYPQNRDQREAMTADRELGFAGMLAAGMTKDEAWQSIHDSLRADPEAMALVLGLDPAVKDSSRAAWAEYGLPPPWEDRDES